MLPLLVLNSRPSGPYGVSPILRYLRYALIDLIETGADAETIEQEAKLHEVRTLRAVLDHDAAQNSTRAAARP